MSSRRVSNVLAAIIVSLVFASVATSAEQAPAWLKASERQTLRTVFGNARPIEAAYISYPKKIAVIWTFRHFVACGLCGSRTDKPLGGRVVRVSFDRQTHGLGGASNGWAMQFCESVGDSPPKQACLHR